MNWHSFVKRSYWLKHLTRVFANPHVNKPRHHFTWKFITFQHRRVTVPNLAQWLRQWSSGTSEHVTVFNWLNSFLINEKLHVWSFFLNFNYVITVYKISLSSRYIFSRSFNFLQNKKQVIGWPKILSSFLFFKVKQKWQLFNSFF